VKKNRHGNGDAPFRPGQSSFSEFAPDAALFYRVMGPDRGTRRPPDLLRSRAMSHSMCPEARLADGTAPLTSADLLARLETLGIAHRTVRHAPVYTVAESRELRADFPGGHSKNLFLRNKKGRMWLVTCLEDRDIDLKVLAERLGAGRFSFASAERLMGYLGVVAGAVTPFAVVNDHGGVVHMVLDAGLLAHDPLHFHPLDNAMTTAISADGLLRFLEYANHAPQIEDLG
jgi:Ala-tRNA(Pro) deacylase